MVIVHDNREPVFQTARGIIKDADTSRQKKEEK
jgi:hypothetical protein